MPAAVVLKSDFASTIFPMVVVVEHQELMAVSSSTSAPVLPNESCASSNYGDESKFIEDSVWGFRITGGAEFGMPITVFHVRACAFAFDAPPQIYLAFICALDCAVRCVSLYINVARAVNEKMCKT